MRLEFVSRRLWATVLMATLAPFAVAVETRPPERPLTIVVPFTQGGPTDELARALGESMGRTLKRPVVVKNVRGAGGTLGAEKVAKAAPDGNTLLLSNIGHATSATLYRKLRYHPVADFEPVGLVADVPMTIVGRRDLQVASLGQLAETAKAGKGELSFGHGGIASASYLCGLLLKDAMKAEFVTVPYQGTQDALFDLAGRHIDLMCDQTTNTLKALRAGQIKAFSVTTKERLRILPDVPTLGEVGVSGFELVIWHGLYAPKGTRKETVERLAAALQRALADPRLKEKFVKLGAQPVAAAQANPEGLRAKLSSEIEKWKPLIERSGSYAD